MLDWTLETRRQDSAECGGPPNESIQFGSNVLKAAQRSEETDRQTEMRLNQEWHACMTEKIYRNTRAVPEQNQQEIYCIIRRYSLKYF